MSFKIVLLVAVLAASVSGLNAKDISRVRRDVSTASAEPWYAKGVKFNYDCSGKQDGNYPHPTLCTHYVACVAESVAYEMVCALNHDGKPLHYVQNSGPDPTTSRCDYPEVAGCSGPAPETTTTAAPSEPETTVAPPPNTCNPDECKLEGDCQSYRQCVSTGVAGQGTWVSHNCSAEGDLFWNPEVSSIHGGVCDYFSDLSPALQERYQADKSCIKSCEWFQDEADSCSPNYTYRRQFDGTTNSGRESRLACPAAPAGQETLLWNQATLTCDKCSNVSDAKGNPCKCQQ